MGAHLLFTKKLVNEVNQWEKSDPVSFYQLNFTEVTDRTSSCYKLKDYVQRVNLWNSFHEELKTCEMLSSTKNIFKTKQEESEL